MIERAKKILKKWKLEYKEDKTLLELFEKSFENNPIIMPYHIPHLDADFLESLKGKEVVVENKYDGTHIQISPVGIFNHNGKPIAPDQLAMLMHLSIFDEFQEILSEAKEKIFEIEVFGKKYTPGGYHKDWEKPIDFVVFEVGIKENNVWRWDFKEKIKLKKIPKIEIIRVNSVKDTFKKITGLSKREDFFEGAVIKYYSKEKISELENYFVDGFLYIAKHKAKEYAKAPERFRGKEDLFDEIVNEFKKRIRKIPTYEEKRRIVKEIVDYIFDKHPELAEKYKLEREKFESVVYVALKWYLINFLNSF